MAAALPLRQDFTAADLRLQARRTRDASQARRLLALACIYEGGSRSEAATTGGVTLQVVRDWVIRFNAAGPAGLIDRRAPGPSRRLDEQQRRALAALVESGPMQAVHQVVRWRLVDLAQWVWEEFRIDISAQTVSRELRALGYRKLTARPRHHAQGAGAIEAIKKNFPAALEAFARAKGLEPARLEVWFADEARIGQKNKITRRWARRGTRPVAPHDQRTASAYIFGAICPSRAREPRSCCPTATPRR